jgi:circadian clock protein KaiC
MAKRSSRRIRQLEKCPTGIAGLDEVTGGGLPRGRPTLVCGAAGCGKSLLGIEFLVHGVNEFDEPGVLMTFEENAEDIKKNVASLGYDLDEMIRRKKLSIDYVAIDRQEIDENGEYDLEGIFIRLDYAIRQVNAKRVMLDTIETLFSGLDNQAILRAELGRLFKWLKARGMTTVITGERGSGALTRQGLEEYVSDCVILLDHRVIDQISTRRVRVVKYRGSTHGTNEYPFLIDEQGISVLPITSIGLNHKASTQRVGTGIERLDTMRGGGGFYRGSSILVSGTAGTGKSTIAACFANATCLRKERCLYFAFEESEHQIIRNMRSIGLDLAPHVRSGLLHIFPARPSLHGVEMHLAVMHKRINELKPTAVIIDPMSNFVSVGNATDVHSMLTRLVDFLKMNEITTLFTALTGGGAAMEATEVSMSSVMDTWLLVRDIEYGGERTRGLYVLKSRGMAHSNQIREFLLTKDGVKLLDVYTGAEGVLTGSARLAQEARERAAGALREQEIERRRIEMDQKRAALEAKIEALRSEFAAEHSAMLRDLEISEQQQNTLSADRAAMALSRKMDLPAGNGDAHKNKR